MHQVVADPESSDDNGMHQVVADLVTVVLSRISVKFWKITKQPRKGNEIRF